MKKSGLWTWLNLNCFIGVIHPRILFYLNKLIPGLRRSATKNIQHLRVEGAGFNKKVNHAFVALPKPEFLDNGYLRSPAGLIVFKKLITSPVLPEYLECQLEGLEYFDKVFRGDDGDVVFNEMMIEHHRILAIGLAGQRNYKVRGFSEEHSKDVAGKLRPAGGQVALGVRDTEMVNVVLRALAEIEFYPDGAWQIQIDDIPTEARSNALRFRRGFNIVHPDAKYVPLYFSKMEQCLSRIRHLSSEVETDKERLLQLLAAYFHLGIHAHAFVRINQSLLMAQVNYILMLNRLRPVYHGYVDLAAAFLDSGNFFPYFKRYVTHTAAQNET